MVAKVLKSALLFPAYFFNGSTTSRKQFNLLYNAGCSEQQHVMHSLNYFTKMFGFEEKRKINWFWHVVALCIGILKRFQRFNFEIALFRFRILLNSVLEWSTGRLVAFFYVYLVFWAPKIWPRALA